MVTFILVSHSKRITDGLKEMIEEMTSHSGKLTIVSAGGTDTGELGTDPIKILTEMQAHADSEQIYLLADIGSAIMSIESAMELAEDEIRHKCVYIDGPLVEGAFVACVQAMIGADQNDIVAAVKNMYRDAQ